MFPSVKITHPQQYPQRLKHQDGPYPTADSTHYPPNPRRLARYCCRYYHATTTPTTILSGGDHVGATCLTSSTRHPRDWVEGTYYIQVRHNEGPSHDCRVAPADIAVFVRRSQATLY